MKTENNKFILDIAPLTRISLTRNQSFSYLHDAKLSVGTLVEIPFSGRKIEGIVLGSRKDFPRLGNIELKKVEKVIEEKFLSEKQIELAKFISEYYISPPGTVLKSFVPKRVKRKKKKEESIKQVDSGVKKIELTTEQKIAISEVIKKACCLSRTPSFLLFGPSGSGKTEVYIHSILELRKKDKDLQFLILVPEKTLTPQALERYGQYFPAEEIVVISSNISAGLLYSNWIKIRSGEAKIIIATRKGAFSPFAKLGMIVVDEEQDISHKNWDMSPRYDARKLAEELGKMHNCPVVFGSATPSVERYYLSRRNEIKLVTLPRLQINPLNSKSQITCLAGRQANYKKNLNLKFQIPGADVVDMRKERWAKNFGCISKKLKGEIEYALKNKQQAILFINRQGMSSFSVCQSCKTVLRCPKCERSLVYDNKGVHRCIHCAHKTSIVPRCEKCKGIVFKNVGLGTQKVEREAQNLFLGARIARIDSQAVREKGYQEKIYKKFSDREIDILIGTQMIAKGWDLPSVALVGIIDADNLLTLPDFRTGEFFFQNLVQISGRTGRPGAKFPGTVIIQTYAPENKYIKMAAEKDYKVFFQKEIEERKILSYPPFSKIIKLIFQDYSSKKVLTETERVYKCLKNISGPKIIQPAEAFVPNIRGRHRRQIIIKSNGNIPEKLNSELKKLGSGWIIDVDPVSII